MAVLASLSLISVPGDKTMSLERGQTVEMLSPRDDKKDEKREGVINCSS